MTKKNLSGVALLVLASSVPFSCDNSSSDDEKSEYSDKIESITLLKATKSWDGTLYDSYPGGQPEISVLKISVPPHKTLDWHKHPMINAAYIEKGEIQIERKDDGRTHWVRQGQALPEVVNTAHRGKTGDKGATLIVFYSGTTDLPVSEPVQ
ncbi:cupin [Chryseobacterium gallinarum]|uniref:Cupin n=1 Tax=Chryseobacterium gallinarum TaxID=1324352 RepID=A0A0G3M4C7_CHRGL|nr:cupin domain-containing protein [Chryseobacterium gallinarum]AKK73704.1 cupin [Chryseobacterium gallinarum]